MKEKHDEYSYRIAMKDVRHDPIEWYQEYGLPEVWTDDKGHTFTLLKTGAEIKKEGLDMKHCVGSYYQRCYNKNYVVYSVENPEGERSTLGIHVGNGSSNVFMLNGNVTSVEENEDHVEYTFNQMYGACNKMVSMEEGVAGDRLITHLNKHCQYPKEQKDD